MNDLILSKEDQLNVWDFAVKLSKSKMVPYIFQGKPEDVFVTVLYGREYGMSPVVSLNSLCVIQGQVTMKVQTMNAIVRKNCPTAIIDIKQDDKALVVSVEAKRHKDDLPYIVTWDMDRAKKMGLASKDNWVKQPLTMLKARALSDALRTVFPDLLNGLYSEEEMKDTDVIETSATLKSQIDEDFPIDPADLEIGDNYLIQNGSLRGKRFGEVGVDKLCEYRETMIKRGAKKDWEQTLISAIAQYASTVEE